MPAGTSWTRLHKSSKHLDLGSFCWRQNLRHAGSELTVLTCRISILSGIAKTSWCWHDRLQKPTQTQSQPWSAAGLATDLWEKHRRQCADRNKMVSLIPCWSQVPWAMWDAMSPPPPPTPPCSELHPGRRGLHDASRAGDVPRRGGGARRWTRQESEPEWKHDNAASHRRDLISCCHGDTKWLCSLSIKQAMNSLKEII